MGQVGDALVGGVWVGVGCGCGGWVLILVWCAGAVAMVAAPWVFVVGEARIRWGLRLDLRLMCLNSGESRSLD